MWIWKIYMPQYMLIDNGDDDQTIFSAPNDTKAVHRAFAILDVELIKLNEPRKEKKTMKKK